MTSIYHILDKVPAIYEEDMQSEYEHLAKELVNSGKLRIDTDYYCNFIRFTDPNSNINIFLSHEELTNPDLILASKNHIRKVYSKNNRPISNDKLSSIMIDMNKKIRKLLIVSDELKIQLARVFVQSARPIVIKWLLLRPFNNEVQL